jgi:hypothetical protein
VSTTRSASWPLNNWLPNRAKLIISAFCLGQRALLAGLTRSELFRRTLFKMTPDLIHDGTIYVDLCGLTDRH